LSIGFINFNGYIQVCRRKDNMKKSIAIIGYGAQGRAIAQNLKDSGYDVTIGLRTGSKSRAIAKKDGFTQITTISNAVKKTRYACFAFPDHLHSKVYKEDIEKNIVKGATLLFLQGMSVHFGFVVPPEDIDVILIAPHAPGADVRENYIKKGSISAFYAIDHDFSGKAEKNVMEIAKGIGFQKMSLVRTTFEQEAVGDLFGEQAVLCGGMAALIKNGFEVLVENGFSAENAYLEVAYQLDLIIAMIKKHGIEGMLERISVAAAYGSVKTGPKIIDHNVKKRMQTSFNWIRSGRFTHELSKLSDKDLKKLKEDFYYMSDPRFENVVKKYSK
jgi:ketol-acid reductoisomerase